MRRQLLQFALGFLLVLGLGEACLHGFDPYHYSLIVDKEQYGAAILDPQTRALRPGVVAEYLGTRTQISSQGLRSPEVPGAKAPNSYRILFLGGSVVFGWGVGEGQDFPRRVEEELRRRRLPAGRRVEVINAGVPGREAQRSLAFLGERGPALRPDLVCMFLVATDLGIRGDLGMATGRRFLTTTLRRCRLLRALENRLVYGSAGNRVGGALSVESQVEDAALPVVRQGLEAFVRRCRALGAQAMVVDTLGKPQMRGMLSDLDLWYVDGFVAPSRRRGWEVAPTDPHMGVAGHRHYAELITGALSARLIR